MDLRVPVGLLFLTLGLIMGIFGLTSNPAMYQKSLGINVNLYWGLVELIFGSLMIAFGRSAHQLSDTKPTTAAHEPSQAPPFAARVPGSRPTATTTRGDLPPTPAVKPPVRHG